jgi:hypothetical protein
MNTNLGDIAIAYKAGNFKKAFQIASKSQYLGEHRAAILDAYTAMTNPRWTVQMRKDVDQTIHAGICALISKYELDKI